MQRESSKASDFNPIVGDYRPTHVFDNAVNRQINIFECYMRLFFSQGFSSDLIMLGSVVIGYLFNQSKLKIDMCVICPIFLSEMPQYLV